MAHCLTPERTPATSQDFAKGRIPQARVSSLDLTPFLILHRSPFCSLQKPVSLHHYEVGSGRTVLTKTAKTKSPNHLNGMPSERRLSVFFLGDVRFTPPFYGIVGRSYALLNCPEFYAAQEGSMKDKDSKDKRSELRQRAELAAAEKSLGISDVAALSPEKVQQLIHELQVHQIELEMQNEELRQAQIKLGELKDRYLDLYDFAPVGYVTMNEKGMILQANLTAVRLLGEDRQSLIKTFFSRLVSPEFGDAYYLHLQQVFETQSKQTCEIKLARKDGSHFYAQLESVAVQDEDGEYSRCQTIVMDASERKRAEGVQRESDERNRFLAGVVENSSQPFGTGYPDGRLGIVNRAFCDLTGYSEEELRHIDWNVTLTPPEWIESEMQHLTELELTGKPVRYEKRYIRKDGTRVPIELLVHVVRGETGEPLHYQAFVTDLTERKRSEEMLLRAKKDWEDIFQAIGHVALDP